MDQMNIRICEIMSCIKDIKENEAYYSSSLLQRIRHKKDLIELSNLKKDIEKIILSLNDDEWTIRYLINLQETLILYFSILKPFINDRFTIPDYETRTTNMFLPMYFHPTKTRTVELSIIGENIEFTIIDNNSGSTFSISSTNTIQSSQRNEEMICKKILTDVLLSYLKGDDKDATTKTS